MSDAAWFVLVFGGLFVLRGIAATIVFLWILPDGVRCPQCDAETLRVEPGRVMRLLKGFRPSWCIRCGWHGVHRIAPPSPSRPRATYPVSVSRPPAERP
jgi:hypothetical protein